MMSDVYSPHDIVRSGLCIGCGSCVARTKPEIATMDFDNNGQLKPKGNAAWYRERSETFSQTCPFSSKAANEDELAAARFGDLKHSAGTGFMRSAFVGHVAEDEYRMNGSSGGMVTWVAAELLKRGLVDGVAHVVAVDDPQTDGRYFRYRISRNDADIRQGAKSRYYPIEMSEILRAIESTPGRYAVVGIPCFIKAVHLLRRQNATLRERIVFTLGLFCGHMKSANFVESFAWQMNVQSNSIRQVDYRFKDVNRPANHYNTMLALNNGAVKNKDWWHLADGDWGAGFFMNSACNFCDDVMAETADIAFGDAWVEPYSSDGRGTNVVVVRSAIINDLLNEAINKQRLCLQSVDNHFVEQTQAAGLRQRREGLAYRLTWATKNIQPKKRVLPSADQSKQRKIIYRLRYYIAKWSHRMFRLAQRLNTPAIYLTWAKTVAAVYHGFAYHKGKVGEMYKRFGTFGK